MIKRVLAVAALSFALPAFATIYEVENNGSIPTAQTLGLTGAGTVSIEGAITTNAIDGKADFDFFSLGRFAAGGSIKARVFGNLSFDPVAALYNSKGQMLSLNDDEDTFKYGSRSYIDYITLADDDYFLAVIGYQWRLITDAVPLNPLSETPGNKIGSQGGYTISLGYDTGLQIPAQPPVKPQQNGTVPEPSALALSALGLLALLGRRRNRGAA